MPKRLKPKPAARTNEECFFIVFISADVMSRASFLTRPYFSSLSTQLRCEIEHVFGHNIKLTWIGFVRLPSRSIFFGPMDESGPQSKTARGIEIANVCSDHHDFLRFQTQEVNCGQIRFAVRLV